MTLLEYASQPSLSRDATYTIELLIESVAWHYAENYFEDARERDRKRREPGYQPSFSMSELEQAYPFLLQRDWLSLDFSNPKIVDTTPLSFLTSLRKLNLPDNEVRDIEPLRKLTELRSVRLDRNPVLDLSPLTSLPNLVELSIARIDHAELSPLQHIRELDELTISASQLDAFKECEELSRLRFLTVQDLDLPVVGFWSFPNMPALRELVISNVETFDGIQKFPRLCNLTNITGDFDDLGPVGQLAELTHMNVLRSNVRSLEPLAANIELRAIYLSSDRLKDISPLLSLPNLRHANVTGKRIKPRMLDKLTAGLTSWDSDFRAMSMQATPAIDLKIVSDEQFEFYDTQERFGVGAMDDNRSMLSSEAEWIEAAMSDKLRAFLSEDVDFYLPGKVHYSRSTTVCLYTEIAAERLVDVVTQIQSCLCWARNPWIIYLQSDLPESGSAEKDFEMWVYRDHLEAKACDEARIRDLLGA